VIVLSTQAMPFGEPEWVVPPTPSTSAEFGNSPRSVRLPMYGVAASSVSPISRMPGACPPSTFTGVPDLAGQSRHGALNQALPQVRNGALR